MFGSTFTTVANLVQDGKVTINLKMKLSLPPCYQGWKDCALRSARGYGTKLE